MESVVFIEWCLEHLNYLTIFLLMVIESSFIPFPSEVVVAPAAYLAAEGELNVVLVVIAATFGANVGALINYYIAFYVGRPVVYKFVNSKFGRLCLLDEEKVHQAEEFFAKRGALSTFIGRLIQQFANYIHTCPVWQSESYNIFALTTLGAGVWNTVLQHSDYYFHSIMSKER